MKMSCLPLMKELMLFWAEGALEKGDIKDKVLLLLPHRHKLLFFFFLTKKVLKSSATVICAIFKMHYALENNHY